MATTYQQCGDEVDRLIRQVMEKHHAELYEHKVTIQAIGARRESKKEGSVPALKSDGMIVAAKIQITSLQDRSRGIADAKMVIDMMTWDTMAVTRKEALIDHELMHLKVAHERPTKANDWDASVKFDDLGRPMLKARPHDWRLTGFAAVVERHGEASVESAQFLSFRAEFGQLNLFSGQVEKPKEKKSAKKEEKADA